MRITQSAETISKRNRIHVILWLCLVLSGLVIPQKGFGKKVETMGCGSWSDPRIWSGGRLPLPADTVEIRHFVAFDQDFTSSQPGLLLVTANGILCGPHRYQGHLQALGKVSIDELALTYGSSLDNYALLLIASKMTLTGTSSWRNRLRTCVGCSAKCENCTFTFTEVPPPPDPTNPPQPNPEEPPLPLYVPEFPSHLIRNGSPENRQLKPMDDSSLVYFDLQVFNRWGLQVYKGRHSTGGWEGKDPLGQPLSEGVYYYQLIYQPKSRPGYRDGIGQIRGSITLL